MLSILRLRAHLLLYALLVFAYESLRTDEHSAIAIIWIHSALPSIRQQQVFLLADRKVEQGFADLVARIKSL